ncbi:CRISPR-associated endonuclease Cas2 [Nitrincola tibetensis]|nr:CRISPR-associated endonuclease Cas2 [Nitrincola tibetensis]
MHLQHYLVCYDIADPRRLQRVFKASRKVGIAFQYSVVYLYCTDEKLDEFLLYISQLINPLEDDIRAYRISSVNHIKTLGEPLIPEGIHARWTVHFS